MTIRDVVGMIIWSEIGREGESEEGKREARQKEKSPRKNQRTEGEGGIERGVQYVPFFL